MFDVKKLQRFSMEEFLGSVREEPDSNGKWVHYADVLEMVLDAMSRSHAQGACPKCGGSNVVAAFMPAGAVYLVESAWGFKPNKPEDLSEDGQSVQATEDHILHRCSCGWKWVNPCKDAPVEVVHA